MSRPRLPLHRRRLSVASIEGYHRSSISIFPLRYAISPLSHQSSERSVRTKMRTSCRRASCIPSRSIPSFNPLLAMGRRFPLHSSVLMGTMEQGPHHLIQQEKLVRIISSPCATSTFKSSARRGLRCSVLRRTTPYGRDSVARVRPKMPVTQLLFMISLPTAGCFRSSLAEQHHSLTALRFRKHLIQQAPISVMRS